MAGSKRVVFSPLPAQGIGRDPDSWKVGTILLFSNAESDLSIWQLWKFRYIAKPDSVKWESRLK